MKILVTGATGLVGGAIINELLKDQHHVVALHRATTDRATTLFNPTLVEWYEADLLDILALDAIVSEVDYVIHTAATVSFVPKHRKQMYEINVQGTANIVNACLANGVKKLCHISSVAALGPADSRKSKQAGTITINEENRWEDSDENSHYAKTKHLAELEVWRGVAEGLSAVIVNPSVILGEGDWNRSSTQLFRYIYNENIFYTEGYLNYVDVQDVAKASCQLLFSMIESERFILNGGRIAYKEFFDRIALLMNKKQPSYKVNRLAASIIWRLEAVRTWLLGSNPLITKETARSAYRNVYFSGEKIQKDLGFSFTHLDSSLNRICQYLLAQNALAQHQGTK